MSDPWILAGRKARDDLDIYLDLGPDDANVAVAIVLAAVHPEYDRVSANFNHMCERRDALIAERDAWEADAGEAWAIIDHLRSIPVVTDPDLYDAVKIRADIEWMNDAKAAHDRLVAGQTEADQ